MKAWWRRVRPRILPYPIYWLVRLILATVKIQLIGWDKVEALTTGSILSGWHGRIVLATKVFRGRGVYALISHSRDGEMQNKIFRLFGFKTIRGSTGRGGIKALRECINVLKSGEMMAFTPDGPRGPSGVVQNGMLVMAKKSGAAMIPVGVSANRRWLFRSWDRYMIPKPFSAGVMIFGEPMYLDENASDEQVELVRQQFEKEMHRLERQAEAQFGHATPDWHAPEALTGP